MLDAIRSEQYKTRHTKIFTILCVGALVLGVITVYMNHSMYMAGKIKELSGENALKSGMSNISVAIIFCSIFFYYCQKMHLIVMFCFETRYLN